MGGAGIARLLQKRIESDPVLDTSMRFKFFQVLAWVSGVEGDGGKGGIPHAIRSCACVCFMRVRAARAYATLY